MPAVRKNKLPERLGIILKDRPYCIKDGVTQSLLQGWKECRERCRLILQGWQSDKTRDVLTFGSMIHWLLEHLYKNPYEFIPQWRQDEIVQEGKLTGSEFMKWTASRHMDLEREKAIKEGRIGKTDAFSEDASTARALAVPLIEEYIDKYSESDTEKEWLGLEQLFDVNFQGFRLRGKVDGIFRRPDGKLWIFETKTKGQISPEDIGRALKFDFQSLFYVTAVEIMLGEPVTGVLYNVLRRAQLRRGAQEPIDAFWKRIREDIHTRPDFYFYRTEAIFPTRRKERFKQELAAALVEFNSWLKGEMGQYRNETNCTMRKWNCDFLDSCASNSMTGYNRDRVMFSELEEEE